MKASDYWDPAAFELERARIFDRGWFLAGHESEWSAPRAAYSHSASLGSRPPAHSEKILA